MFLHLGSDIVVALDEVVLINDYKTVRSIANREFLEKVRSQNRIVDVASNSPKSFVVTKEKIYLSAISSVTLKKRAANLLYSED